jgi:hypothetical protein
VNDKHLFYGAIALIILPLTLGFFGGDKFRYPCQDPANWEKDFCKFPICDVTRTCPEHIFKGQRDPRLGPPKPESTPAVTSTFTPAPAQCTQPKGANCGK